MNVDLESKDLYQMLSTKATRLASGYMGLWLSSLCSCAGLYMHTMHSLLEGLQT